MRPGWVLLRSLARYRGRTLDAYRSDLRGFFQWAADTELEVLKATRPQIEWYVRALEARGLASTTVDRRLSTVCGYYRFAHIDGRIPSNPAQYVRHPKDPPQRGSWTRPGRARSVPGHRRPLRPSPRCPRRHPRPERPAGK